MRNSRFTHLHLHTEYSLLDGACTIKKLPALLKSLGMTSVAITDHGNMYGVIEFYKTMKENGIKPIIGCEVYVAPYGKSRFDKQGEYYGESDKKYNHLILLAKNQKGYENLMKIVSIGWTEGFYYKPRVDMEILKKYNEGLIASSACLGGAVNQALLASDYEQAKEIAQAHKDIFGEDFYLEIQDHGLDGQKKINPYILELGKDLGIKVVATCDSHYLTKEDYDAHEILLAIQTKTTMSDPNRFSFEKNEFYVKSEEEMLEIFKDNPEVVYNTQEIVDKCNFEMHFGDIHLPDYNYPKDKYASEADFFKDLVKKGLVERYGRHIPVSYLKRAAYELGIIEKMHFVGYFNIVSDFIRWAKEHDIPVGPGRGCTDHDTKILTSEGYKYIKDIEIGDLVYTHEGRLKKVTNTFIYDNLDILIKPCVYLGDNVGDFYTPEHKIFALKNGNKEPSWVEAKDLEVGDYACFPKISDSFGLDINKVKLSLGSSYKDFFYDDDQYIYKKIYKIKNRENVNKVYDITVEDDHSYVTASFAAHNSAAGSIVAYATHITDIDPMKNDLLFERFLNPERISFPDIDVDFCYDRRGEVIDYVSHQYGKDRVSQIVTFGTMAARSSIRDVARAMEIPISQADKIAKSIPEEIGMTLEKALKLSPEFGNYYTSSETYKKLIDTAIKIEGSPRHTSKHAAGVVIADDDIAKYAPLMTADGEPVVQFPMTQIEDLGLIKMDFLGLRTLTVIKNACDTIKKKYGTEVPLSEIIAHPENYPEVYQMLQEGGTSGVFQFESAGMTDLLGSMYIDAVDAEYAETDEERKKYGQEFFNRLVAAVALYRPRPNAVYSRLFKRYA